MVALSRNEGGNAPGDQDATMASCSVDTVRRKHRTRTRLAGLNRSGTVRHPIGVSPLQQHRWDNNGGCSHARHASARSKFRCGNFRWEDGYKPILVPRILCWGGCNQAFVPIAGVLCGQLFMG